MAKVSFNNRSQVFAQSLKNSIDQYFQTNGLKKTGDWRLYIKALTLIPAALLIYSFLLLGTYEPRVGIALVMILGVTLSSIGFNVMHDACHGSYSSKKWVNNILGFSLNALGGNAFFWKQKHNILHHTYTNIAGLDDDIAQSKLVRQSPAQEWKPIHRYQHIYLPIAYSMTIFMWVLVRDFDKYFKGKIQNTAIQPMNTKEHIIFWISKVFYIFFYIVLPIICLGFKTWLIGFLIMGVIMGIVLAYVFQLAHAVEGPEFDAVGIEDKVIETEWAVHQIKTTANFAPNDRVLTWLVGGLNYQVEHHLFPRISHLHYPAISKIVRAECAKHNLPYHSFNTMGAAIVSHMRIMKKLGKKTELA
ncbi:MAG: acyl-CoA desaturase [Chitinophagaceae bacterium]